MTRTAFLMLCLGLVFPTLVSGQAPFDVQLDADDRGWYLDDGFHDSANENYLSGIFDFNNVRSTRNSFFVFDLLNINVVQDATLRVFLPTNGYNSPDSTETFTLFDYTGDLTNLVDGTAGIPGFDDLGTGVAFGSADIEVADENSFVDIQLNADGISFLNSSAGGFVALGGAVTSLNTTLGAEYVFGDTEAGLVPAPQLIVTTVPEPSSIALIGLAFAAVTTRRKRSA